jgi:transposase
MDAAGEIRWQGKAATEPGELVRMGSYREMKVKRQATHVDGALLASRALLVQQRCELDNRLRGLLKNFGLCGEDVGRKLAHRSRLRSPC